MATLSRLKKHIDTNDPHCWDPLKKKCDPKTHSCSKRNVIRARGLAKTIHRKITDPLGCRLLLVRHGEGEHLVCPEKINPATGPSLTRTGSGQAYRRITRQLKQRGEIPNYALFSPQLRAMQTLLFSRKNRRYLKLPDEKHPDGILLRDIECQLLPFAYEKTSQLAGQGNIVPLLDDFEKWGFSDAFSKDTLMLEEIEKSLPRTDPPADHGKERAKRILQYCRAKFKNKTVMLVAHDGILRDMISQYTGPDVPPCEDVFDLCELRSLSQYVEDEKKRYLVPEIDKTPRSKTRKKATKKKKK